MSAIGTAQAPADRPTGPGVLVVVEAYQEATAREAVDAANGSVTGCVAWPAAAERLTWPGTAGVVLAEARGADDAALAHALPLLDRIARDGDAQVVLTFDVEQIDVVAATMLQSRATLLCNPSPTERFVAVSLAGHAGGGSAVNEDGREADAVRLRQLNAEIGRIVETLGRLTRSMGRADEANTGFVGEAGVGYRVPATGTQTATDRPNIAPREIREAIRARRMRDQIFGAGLFEDPAWDMLLDLFAAELERAQVSVSSLCIASMVAPTTALRWIGRMTEAGLFRRDPDPFDRRRAFMALSERASAGMRDYVAAVRRAGLAIG